MPPIEVGGPRAIGTVSANPPVKTVTDTTVAVHAGQTVAANATAESGGSGTTAPVNVHLDTSEALNPGHAPVDVERVSQIRKAVESGSYPLVPARIADAMIAAGLLLRSTKA